LLRKQQEARANGEAFNPYDAANVLVKSEEVQQEIKKQETARTRLNKKFEDNKLTYDPNRIYTKEDLKRLGFSDSVAGSILTIQKGR